VDFDYNDEQKMFKQGARDFFEKEVPKSLVKKMADDENGKSAGFMEENGPTGMAGLDLSEQYGGSGG